MPAPVEGSRRVEGPAAESALNYAQTAAQGLGPWIGFDRPVDRERIEGGAALNQPLGRATGPPRQARAVARRTAAGYLPDPQGGRTSCRCSLLDCIRVGSGRDACSRGPQCEVPMDRRADQSSGGAACIGYQGRRTPRSLAVWVGRSGTRSQPAMPEGRARALTPRCRRADAPLSHRRQG
jgi:hypothetical protein